MANLTILESLIAGCFWILLGIPKWYKFTFPVCLILLWYFIGQNVSERLSNKSTERYYRDVETCLEEVEPPYRNPAKHFKQCKKDVLDMYDAISSIYD